MIETINDLSVCMTSDKSYLQIPTVPLLLLLYCSQGNLASLSTPLCSSVSFYTLHSDNHDARVHCMLKNYLCDSKGITEGALVCPRDCGLLQWVSSSLLC